LRKISRQNNRPHQDLLENSLIVRHKLAHRKLGTCDTMSALGPEADIMMGI
jgi:hypothetical protein